MLLVQASRFLSDADVSTCRSASAIFTAPAIYADLPTAPFQIPTRRRYRGFGARSLYCSATHDRPSPLFILHHAWRFLDRTSRMTCVEGIPFMRDYARLRVDAFVHRITIREALKAPRLPNPLEPQLCHFRAWFMGAALLSFDLDYGDMIRWMEGEYTDAHRDWSELGAFIEEIQQYSQRPGYPDINPEMALEACMTGIPLAGRFECKRDDVIRRVCYDNHSPAAEYAVDLRRKFAAEEANSYHIAFPRFLVFFIPGIMIAPISWVIRKGKGRIVIDPSTKLTPEDTGAANDYIPRPGEPGRERETPPVSCGTAVQRYMTALYNMRIDHPREELLQHSDDIDAAFRRCKYRPDLAIVFAYVFMEFLMVPVGAIFGARNSPSWFELQGESRAHAASVLQYATDQVHLADQVVFSDPPTEADIDQFVQAVPDEFNQGIPEDLRDRSQHVMCVDDDITVAIYSRMREAIRSAEGSAYGWWGRPEDDRRGSVLQPTKFPLFAGPDIHHLGLLFHTRSLRVDWPEDKQSELYEMLKEWIHHRTSRTPSEISKLLGRIRNGGYLCTFGLCMSLRLQWILSAEVKRASWDHVTDKRWWQYRKIHIPPEVYADLSLICRTLEDSLQGRHSIWSRPIALLIRRAITAEARSDASYNGIGGWSPHFKFMWRVTRAQLLQIGFNMRAIDADGEAIRRADPDSLHINVLEFLAIIINVWFCIRYTKQDPDKAGGHIVQITADNTSALSWFRYAARSHRPVVRTLAYICHCIIAFSQTSDFANYTGRHLPGKENDEADALSRPELFPTLASAIERFCQLQTCRAFQLPFGLLSTIARAISSEEIGASFVNEMMTLLTLEPIGSPLGVNGMPLKDGFYRRSRRKRR